MIKLLEYIFLFLIFPGFLFSSTMGLLVGWVDRKVTARVQWRVGPPWYQNFADVIKLLFYKETLIPEGVSKGFFLGIPVIAAAAAALVSTIVMMANIFPGNGFVGDIIVVVYLLMIPPIAIMIGGFVSGNPLASLGASREIKLMLSYELPFILSLSVPILKSGYAIKIGDILAHQQPVYFFASASGVISCIVMLLCIQAKLGFVPFDMPEAETEIMAGAYIEYSGKTLGIFKLAKAMLIFIVPVLVITLYFGGIHFTVNGFLKNVLQYILILVFMIVVKNTNPRVRIDQAMRFFWGPMTILALVAVVLAYFGL